MSFIDSFYAGSLMQSVICDMPCIPTISDIVTLPSHMYELVLICKSCVPDLPLFYMSDLLDVWFISHPPNTRD